MLSILLSTLTYTTAPSRSLLPAEVVTAQLEALQKGDVRTCFKFASPMNRRATGPATRFERMVRDSPAYAPLIGSTSFEILSALSVSPKKWRCRVRVRPAGGSLAPFAVANPVVEYSWELSQQGDEEAAFGLGQCMRHLKYAYRGVIVGCDLTCVQGDEWIRKNGVEKLARGKEQPFYHVMVDERDRPGGVITYVAEENVAADRPRERLQHPAAADLLVRFDAENGKYDVPKELVEKAECKNVAGCWLVDGVTPDRAVVE